MAPGQGANQPKEGSRLRIIYFTFLVSLLGPACAGEKVIRDLGIFKTINKSHAAIGDNGNVFILDRAEYQLLIFSPDGEHLRTIGRKGKGPGEFERPYYITAAEILMVYEGAELEWFDLDGNALGSSKKSPRLTYVVKNKVFSLSQRYNTNDPAAILSSEMGSDEIKKYFEWQPERLLPLQETYKPNKTTISFNPVKETIFLTLSATQRYLYLAHMGPHFKITVFDLEKNEHRTLSRPIDPVPFDKDWGQTDIDKRNAFSKNLKFTLADIDYFPIIRGLMTGPDDEIVVSLWTASPDKKSRYLVMSPDGKNAELPFPVEITPRLIGVQEGIGWLAAWDEESGAYIVRVPVAELSEAAKAHPWIAKNDEPIDTILPL